MNTCADQTRGEAIVSSTQRLSACAEGCYKHYVNGKWVCCKCGS